MKCRRAKDLIHDFIDGVIGDPDRSALEQHLTECPSCEENASSLSSSLDLLHRLPAEQLDENFTWKVRLQIARARNAAESDVEAQRGWLRAWNTRFAFSAAAAFVVVVGIGYFAASSFVLPGDTETNTPLLANRPQPQTQPNRTVQRPVQPPAYGRYGAGVGPTPVALGGNPQSTTSGGLFEDAPYTNLDSLKTEVYKSRLADAQVKLLRDQVDHLQSELRNCESECPKGGE